MAIRELDNDDDEQTLVAVILSTFSGKMSVSTMSITNIRDYL